MASKDEVYTSWQNIVYQFEYMTDENLMDDNYHRFCYNWLHHSSIHKTAGLEGSKHLLFHKNNFYRDQGIFHQTH